jgi:hypothetical protein
MSTPVPKGPLATLLFVVHRNFFVRPKDLVEDVFCLNAPSLVFPHGKKVAAPVQDTRIKLILKD